MIGDPLTQSRRKRGQVLVVTVLAVALLAGLIFFVLNTGEQVNRRIAAQNASDAAAISAAVHVARGMNALAMNNVAMSRMLSLVPIVDSLPISVQISFEEADVWAGLMESYWRRRSRFPDDRVSRVMTDGVQYLYERLGRQREALVGVHEMIGELDVPALTTYAIDGDPGPRPHGAFWRAAADLDRFSEATVASAGVAAQIDARRFGRVSQADLAMVAPILPVLPATRGDPELGTSFEQWRLWYRDPAGEDTVLVHGAPPDYEEPSRLGGFDRLFKWRQGKYKDEGPVDGPRPENEGVLVGGATSVSRKRELIGYVPYGPVAWMTKQLYSYWDAHLPDAYLSFQSHFSAQSRAKLDAMFLVSAQAPRLHHPRWVVDYARCKTLASSQNVRQTRYWRIGIRSKYPATDVRFMDSPDTYKMNVPQASRDRLMKSASGWWDPADEISDMKDDYDNNPGYRERVRELTGVNVPQARMSRIAGGIWSFSHVSATTWDGEIDIPRELDPDGMPRWFPVYRYHWFLFGGIDIGGDEPVGNPANFDLSELADLPVPYLLDGDVAPPPTPDGSDERGPGLDDRPLNYLGLALRSARPVVWASRFSTDNPLGSILTVSQAKVYNPTSWDLWTQDWRAELVPVRDLTWWCQRMRERDGDAARRTEIDEDLLDDVVGYLQRVADVDREGDLIQH